MFSACYKPEVPQETFYTQLIRDSDTKFMTEVGRTELNNGSQRMKGGEGFLCR